MSPIASLPHQSQKRCKLLSQTCCWTPLCHKEEQAVPLPPLSSQNSSQGASRDRVSLSPTCIWQVLEPSLLPLNNPWDSAMPPMVGQLQQSVCKPRWLELSGSFWHLLTQDSEWAGHKPQYTVGYPGVIASLTPQPPFIFTSSSFKLWLLESESLVRSGRP